MSEDIVKEEGLEFDTSFENITPWNGANDTGRDVRLKWLRNFKKIRQNFIALMTDADKILGIGDKFLRKDIEDFAKEIITFAKGIKLGEFVSGLLGTGGAILIDDDGNSHAEFDYLTIRKIATFFSIIVQEMKYVGGAFVVSPSGMTCSKVEEMDDCYRCYFDKKDGEKEIHNQFTVGTQARRQTFNLTEQAYYWRLVTGVGDDYIDLSKTDCDTGSTVPQAGDEIVGLGHRTDKTRQAAVIISAYGTDSPSIKYYQGIDSYSLVDKAIKMDYYDPVTGRFKSVTYGDAYIGDKERKSYFEHTVEGGVEVKGKVHIESGSDGWENLSGLSGAFDDAYKDINAAKDAADDAKNAADDAKKEAQSASGRLDEWASDGVISPAEKLALKQEIENLQAEYETNIKNADKYSIDYSQYKSKWEAYKAELVYHSADTPENIPVRVSFRASQSAFYTSRTELLTAIADASKEYADKLVASISVGAENLLLNTGFTGNYEDEELSSSYKLTPTSLLYSNRMFAWEGNAEVIEDKNSASGFAAVIGNLSQNVSTLPNENYVVSYKAKGNSVTVNFGGSSYTQALTSSYVRYVHRFTSGSSSFSISGDATVCELKLERGTVSTDWCPSRKGRNEVADRFKYFWYLQDALQSATQVNGGLVLTTMIMLGKFVDGVLQKINAGISGIYNDDTDVAVWAGGTYEDAIRTVQTLIANPNYQPSEEEWKSMAKFVATHGGDSFFRGFVYALGGIFRGRVETNVNGRRIVIDPSDNSLRMYDANGKICLDMSFLEEDNGRIFSGITVTEYEGNTPFFTSTLSGRRLSFDNLIENYGGIISPDRIFFSNQRSTIFDLKVSDLAGGGKCIDMFANGWNTNDDTPEGYVYVDKTGTMKVKGYGDSEGFTGEVLVHPADKASDRIYLVFENGLIVGTKNG